MIFTRKRNSNAQLLEHQILEQTYHQVLNLHCVHDVDNTEIVRSALRTPLYAFISIITCLKCLSWPSKISKIEFLTKIDRDLSNLKLIEDVKSTWEILFASLLSPALAAT